jgi:hypothetical protein
VEVGETEAAIDLDIVVEYGVSIAELGRGIQRNVKQSVERMTGLQALRSTSPLMTSIFPAPMTRTPARRECHDPAPGGCAAGTIGGCGHQRDQCRGRRRGRAAVRCCSAPDSGWFSEVASYLPGRQMPGVVVRQASRPIQVRSRRAGAGIGMAGAGLIALYGLRALAACAVIALASVLAAWLVALIAVAAQLLAAVADLLGWTSCNEQVRRSRPAPVAASRPISRRLRKGHTDGRRNTRRPGRPASASSRAERDGAVAEPPACRHWAAGRPPACRRGSGPGNTGDP